MFFGDFVGERLHRELRVLEDLCEHLVVSSGCALMAQGKAALFCMRLHGVNFDGVDLKGVACFELVKETIP